MRSRILIIPLLCFGLPCLLFARLSLPSQQNSPIASDDRLRVYLTAGPEVLQPNLPNFTRSVPTPDSAQVIIHLSAAASVLKVSAAGRGELAAVSDTVSIPLAGSGAAVDTMSRIHSIVETVCLKFAAHTPLRDHIRITYRESDEPAPATADPWNNWHFSINLGMNLDRDKSMQADRLNGGFSIRRITEDWKFRSSFYSNYSESRFNFEEIDLVYKNITRNHSFSTTLVRSISDHWSVGGFADASQATYYNNRFTASAAPAVEYNMFPYTESEERSFTFLYRIGYLYRQYWERTIYGKKDEGVMQTSLNARLELTRTWGSLRASVNGSVYLHDLTKNRLTSFVSVDVRLVKKLSFRIHGQFDMIHDQIFLGAGGADLEDVLLRRKRLETSYDYGISFGFNYSFGSLNNDIVNPVF